MKSYKKFIFIGITVVALGVTASTTLKDTVSSLGSVLIAVGGLFFIFGMSLKRKNDEVNQK